MKNVHTNTYTIIQITGEILTVIEEVERCEDVGLTTRHYTIDYKEMDDLSDFVRSLIIE